MVQIIGMIINFWSKYKQHELKKIVANNNDQTKPGDLLVLLEDIDLLNEFNLAKSTTERQNLSL